MSTFLMPSLGADMEAGTLVEWRVAPGDRVARGAVVAVVETQKGAIEVECFEEGVVDQLLVPVGRTVPVGTPLAWLSGPGEPVPTAASRPPPTPAVRHEVGAAAPAAGPSPPPAPAPTVGRPRATPAARRRAGELGLALDEVAGSGPEGAVTLADVEALATAGRARPEVATAPRRGFDPAAMRRAIAQAMSRSKREIPHYYLASTIEMTRALAFLEAANHERPPPERLLPAVLLLKATALGLQEVPELNGFWLEDGFRPGEGVHVGWAVSLRGGGLVAPAIRDADRRTLGELMAALRDLVGRARAGGLRSSELAEPTVTVTSLGERGAEWVQPAIHPPQVAIVGFGRIVTRPWVDAEGGLVARPVVQATLAGDHRATDGHVGGRLLGAIDRLLSAPEEL